MTSCLYKFRCTLSFSGCHLHLPLSRRALSASVWGSLFMFLLPLLSSPLLLLLLRRVYTMWLFCWLALRSAAHPVPVYVSVYVCVCVRCCSFKKFCCILLSVSPLSPSSLSSCFSAQRLVARSPNSSSSSGQQRCSVSKSRFTVLYAPVMSATNKQRQHFRNGESNNQAERLVNNLKVNQLKQYVNWILNWGKKRLNIKYINLQFAQNSPQWKWLDEKIAWHLLGAAHNRFAVD